MILVSLVLSGLSSFDPLYNEALADSEYYNTSDIRVWDLISLISLVGVVAAFMYDAYIAATEKNKQNEKK